jgi:predicted NBD/HSP70 family sugar kinase
VLDRHLFPGRNKLAGAIGAMPVPGRKSEAATLGERASLRALARRAGSKGDLVWSPEGDWSTLGRDLAQWIEELAEGLVHVTRSVVALIDVDGIVVDGAVPPAVRKEIARQLRRGLATRFLDRPEPFTVVEGSFGHLAPAIGGASIPLLVKYSNDKEILFKDDREAVRQA